MYNKYKILILIVFIIFTEGCQDEYSSYDVMTVNMPNNKLIYKSKNVIDLLVIVDKNDPNNFNGKNNTKIDHYISVNNTILQDSTVNAKLNIKKVHSYDFKQSTSMDTLLEIYTNKEIIALRNKVKADIVLIYQKYSNDGYCGLAYTNDTLHKDIAYAHISLDCPSTTTAHEVGHTMGLAHSIKHNNESKLFPYAQGYGITDEFVTVMAYKSRYHTSTRLMTYSSPNLDCKGYACGIDEELENGANAVKSLNYAIDYVSKFR